MKKIVSIIAPALACGLLTTGASAQDRLFVDITQGTAAPLSIGVPDVQSGVILEDAGTSDVAASLAQIIRADLGTSAFFRVVASAEAGSQDDEGLLRAFALGGLQGLVVGRPTLTGDGRLSYSCAFFDVFSGNLEIARQFEVSSRQWRRAGHKCADMVFTHATGYQGHFDTRFTMTAAAGGVIGSPRTVSATDFGGADFGIVLDERQLVAMPRLSPDGRSMIFMSYANDVPQLVMANFDSGNRVTLRLPAGIPSAPRFAPDGRRVVLAISRNGNTDIFEHELATGRTVQLTDTTGIDTSPTYSPDGTSIAFESDRSGEQQIYVMRRDGSDQRRLTFGDRHGSPAWSPQGDRLAFVRFSAGSSRIGVMATDGTAARLVSSGPHDEDPSWARSGRAIALQRTTPAAAESSLWIADINGSREFAVATGFSVSEPNWSEYAE